MKVNNEEQSQKNHITLQKMSKKKNESIKSRNHIARKNQ